jgi:hypothetical protein
VIPSFKSERLYRALSWIVFGTVVMLVALTYRDYGIVWDEEWQNVYGEKLLSYYLSGFQDRSAFAYRDLYLYGGVFDLVAAALTGVSPLGEYETRHLLGGIVGIVGMIGAWRLARLLAGERAAFLAVVLMALTPSLYGHMFMNPKDAPFAWGMVWTIYFACRVVAESPRVPWRVVTGFGIALGLTLATRVAGVLVVAYLAAAGALYVALCARERVSLRALGRDGRILALRLLPAGALAYGLMAVFWPWSVHSPLNPIRALIHFSAVPWKGVVLVDGETYPGTDLPAFYLPLHLAIKLPEIVLAGLVAATIMAVAVLVRGRAGRPDRIRVLCTAIVALSAVFPVLYAVVLRPLDFNGIRHFLFVVPPLVLLAAIGIDSAWTALARVGPALARGFALMLALIGGGQAWIMHGLHPHEYVYFNQLVGGTRGAVGRYELDYWGHSLAEASRALDRYLVQENGGRAVERTYRASVCGYPLSALYFFPAYVAYTTVAAEADFFVSFTHGDCDRTQDGRTIIAVERDGAVLSVVKDRRHIVTAAQDRRAAR